MTYRLLVRPDAEHDIVRAIGWYDANAPDQSERLVDDLAAVMARIRETPKMFRMVHGPVRRAALQVFPFFVWFVLDDETATAQLLAVTHHRRDPASVRARLQG